MGASAEGGTQLRGNGWVSLGTKTHLVSGSGQGRSKATLTLAWSSASLHVGSVLATCHRAHSPTCISLQNSPHFRLQSTSPSSEILSFSAFRAEALAPPALLLPLGRAFWLFPPWEHRDSAPSRLLPQDISQPFKCHPYGDGFWAPVHPGIQNCVHPATHSTPQRVNLLQPFFFLFKN